MGLLNANESRREVNPTVLSQFYRHVVADTLQLDEVFVGVVEEESQVFSASVSMARLETEDENG